jgi:hypothetical protein
MICTLLGRVIEAMIVSAAADGDATTVDDETIRLDQSALTAVDCIFRGMS